MRRIITLSVAAIALELAGSAPADARPERDRSDETTDDGFTSVRLRHDRPQLALGLDFGADRYGAAQAGSDIGFGPVAQARIGAQLHPIISIDARYFVTRHERVGSLVAQGFSFEPRVSLPLWIRPYLSGGFGWYTVAAYQDGNGAIAEAPLALQLPISLGAEWLWSPRLGLQAEGTYRILLDQGSAGGAYFARTQIYGGTLGARAYF